MRVAFERVYTAPEKAQLYGSSMVDKKQGGALVVQSRSVVQGLAESRGATGAGRQTCLGIYNRFDCFRRSLVCLSVQIFILLASSYANCFLNRICLLDLQYLCSCAWVSE